MNKLLDSIHEANSWIFYAVTIIVASLGKMISWISNTAISLHSTIVGSDPDAILTVGSAGKMYLWGIALTDFLYAMVLLATIVGALIKAWIDLSNYLYKRSIRKSRKTDVIDEVAGD